MSLPEDRRLIARGGYGGSISAPSALLTTWRVCLDPMGKPEEKKGITHIMMTTEANSAAAPTLEQYLTDPALSPSGRALAQATVRYVQSRQVTRAENDEQVARIEVAMRFVLGLGSKTNGAPRSPSSQIR